MLAKSYITPAVACVGLLPSSLAVNATMAIRRVSYRLEATYVFYGYAVQVVGSLVTLGDADEHGNSLAVLGEKVRQRILTTRPETIYAGKRPYRLIARHIGD